VHLACRSEAKARPVVDALRSAHGARAAEFLPLDLSSLASVRAAARRYLDGGEPCHVLVDNAGVAGVRGTTADGFELTFGTNHLGHFLFTTLLLERIQASAPARVVVVSSKSHKLARTIPFSKLRRRTGLFPIPAYGVSKLANNLFVAELARRTAGTGVTTYAVHPGVVMSDIWEPLPKVLHPLWFKLRRMVTNEEGARTSLYCATSPDVATQSGRYYAACREAPASRASRDPELARRLWEWSVAATAG
jgi:NAD(P)-dependent dehydrogenase (short-subunit alcohol dehydrogenase family)